MTIRGRIAAAATSVAAATTAAAVLLVLSAVPATATAASSESSPDVAFSLKDERITEASGLAAGRNLKNVFWMHNDSEDQARVFAVDSRSGKTVGTVTLGGVQARDWEGIAVGDGKVFVGDIGDNLGGKWPEVYIYAFDEPKQAGDRTLNAVRYRVQYDTGPRNAEALMFDPVSKRLYIASKNGDGGALYQGPPMDEMSKSLPNTFKRIADMPSTVTDASISPDGSRLAVRGYFSAWEYYWTPARGVAPAKISDVGSLPVPIQRQGEGVAFSSDGRRVLYGSEGAGSSVWRLDLTGKQLPGKVSKPDASAGDSDRGGDEDTTAPSDDSFADKATKPGVTAVVVAVLGLIVVGALRRRR
jgi:Tol biopolymer transport system component